jgi:hypothetical protein
VLSVKIDEDMARLSGEVAREEDIEKSPAATKLLARGSNSSGGSSRGVGHRPESLCLKGV